MFIWCDKHTKKNMWRNFLSGIAKCFDNWKYAASEEGSQIGVVVSQDMIGSQLDKFETLMT